MSPFLKLLLLSAVASGNWLSPATSSLHPSEDFRCKCICPSLAVLPQFNQSDNGRRSYIQVVEKEQCHCEQIVFNLPANYSILNNTTSPDNPPSFIIKENYNGEPVSIEFVQQFCPRCQCEFEVRRTAVAKVIVIILIAMLSMLFVYMLCMLMMEPFCKRNDYSSGDATYEGVSYSLDQDDTDGFVDISTMPSFVRITDPRTPLKYPSNLINRMTSQQNRWKRQLEDQRDAVYKDAVDMFR